MERKKQNQKFVDLLCIAKGKGVKEGSQVFDAYSAVWK